MRVTETLGTNQIWGLFAGDVPGGGCLVECEKCGTEVLSKNDEPLICPKCGSELMYASWWEW